MEFVKYHVFSRFTPSSPQIIQVQTQCGCNARCVFRPTAREENQIRGRMDDATFQAIVEEAIDNNVKVLSPYVQRRGRKRLPRTKLIRNGPKFERTIHNIETFLRVKRELRSRTPRVQVWAVRTKEVDRQLAEVKAFWADRDVRFKARELDNRAHPEVTENAGLAAADDEWKYATYCTIPLWRAWIVWNGDMVLC
ncbi:MAG: hypothetical protein ACE5HQ_07210 [Gemmatimonadota bacterium]